MELPTDVTMTETASKGKELILPGSFFARGEGLPLAKKKKLSHKVGWIILKCRLKRDR